jgi:hypothetical protein
MGPAIDAREETVTVTENDNSATVDLGHGEAIFSRVYDFANVSVHVDAGRHPDLDLLQATPTNPRPPSSLLTFLVASWSSSLSFGLCAPVVPLASRLCVSPSTVWIF